MVFKDAEIIKKPLADGGVGVGALTFLDGELILGINLVKQLADFDATIDGADWIITVEGQLDEQTLSGKTIDGVITSARLKKHTRCGIMWFGEYKCKIAEQIWSHICFFNCERYFYVTRSHQ
ncbi:glycerate kinase [Maribacter sp.]|nr:glycerate kinase [Maribacter sp.]